MAKISIAFLIVIATYLMLGILALRFCLDDLVFKPVPVGKTSETSVIVTPMGENEILIRSYSSQRIEECMIFFPGRSGGIPRYEKEIFNKFSELGLSVHAISYPGYEGAKGRGKLSAIVAHIEKSIRHLETQTSCRVEKSIFVGRSLGAAFAAESARALSPKAIVLDSVGVSLDAVVKSQLKKQFLTKPFSLLPLAKILPVKHDLRSSLMSLDGIEVYIFQGTNDSMLSYDDLKLELKGVALNEMVEVLGADHSNTFKLAADVYVATIHSLLAK